MSDNNRKKKKRKGKNKKKGNDSLPVGAASVESLQFKVDIASPEQVSTDGEGNQITDSVVLKSETTDIHEKESHIAIEGGAAVKTHDLKEDISLDKEKTDTQDAVSYGHVDDYTQRMPDSSKVDTAVASTVEDFFNRSPDICKSTQSEGVEEGLKLSKDNELIIDIQSSPWKIDRDVKEIVEHNTRTRMTKVVRTRKVIITKTEDGDEIETVIEEEDDDNPEVIGEIGAFDETENETVEVQRVIKKRRVISGKTNDDVQYTEYRGEAKMEVPFEEATTITRKVMISKNEFDEDIETVIQEDFMPENETQFDTVAVRAAGDGTHDVVQDDEPKDNDDDIGDNAIKPIDLIAEPGEEACFTLSNNKAQETTSGDDPDVVVPVEVVAVESEVNLEDILGPANAEHEAILEQQRADLDSERSETKYYHGDYCENSIAEETTSTNAETRELVSEECSEIVLDTGPRRNDSPGLSELDIHESKKPVRSKVAQNERIQFNRKLTEEQRNLLDEASIPQSKSVLDDWVLVNFTSKEVMRFAELIRIKPGWLEDSVEMKHCCTMM